MPTMYVQIEVREGTHASLVKALRYMSENDRCFPNVLAGDGYWRLEDGKARGSLARCLSYHGLTGRLSVVAVGPDGQPGPPRWTGFNARKHVQ